MREVYLNTKQLEFVQSTANRKTVNGGRASGKSTMIGSNAWMKFNYMPRSRNLLAGITYAHILTKSLPSIEEFLNKMGMREYDWKLRRGHYVIGIKPPAHWPLSYSKPRRYDHVVSFINGTCMEFFSQDLRDAGRGGSYDSVDIDESAFMNRDIVKKVIFPSIRGNRFKFNHYLHHSKCDYTSPPWLSAGQWIYETEEEMKLDPKNNLYLPVSAFDNKEVLGDQWFIDMKRELTPLEYRVEIKGERIGKVPNSFYPNFSDARHVRRARWDYSQNDTGRMYVKKMLDLDPTLPLAISFDFNADFTSASIWQTHQMSDHIEERCIKVMYVKEGATDEGVNKIDALVAKFIEEYQTHLNKIIHIYGDRNGNNRQVNSDMTFYAQIELRLKKQGWSTRNHVQGLDPEHRLKHRVLNIILSEQDPRMPRIRMIMETTQALVLSINNAPITQDFKKDKKSERNLSVADREKATDLSDTFDYYIFHKYANTFGVSAGKAIAGFI